VVEEVSLLSAADSNLRLTCGPWVLHLISTPHSTFAHALLMIAGLLKRTRSRLMSGGCSSSKVC
jgi:hypothetical protein